MAKPRSPSRQTIALGAALILAMVVAAYLRAMTGDFLLDDDRYVTHNMTLRNLNGLYQIWGHLSATVQYYPLTFTSFWIEYHLWGLRPLGYHLVNVLLHGLNGILLWLVLRRLAVPGAWLAAALFAVHPVHVESVAWITERKNVLSGAFYLAATLAYFRFCQVGQDARQPAPAWGWYLLAVALFWLALLSKTLTCSLPVAILLLLWWKRRRLGRADLWPLLPLFGLGLAMGLVTTWVEHHQVGAEGEPWALSWVQRCLVAGRAIWFYLAKLAWPCRLTFIYPRWHVDTGQWWQFLFPLAAVGLLASLWLLRRQPKDRARFCNNNEPRASARAALPSQVHHMIMHGHLGRGPFVAASFFVITLAPALGFLSIYYMQYSYVADHFQYLASIGPITLFAALLTRLASKPTLRWSFSTTLLALLVVLTWQRCQPYRSLEALWRDTLAQNPGAWLAHNNLGVLLDQQGHTDEAIKCCARALALNPDYVLALNNLGVFLAKQGDFTKAAQYLSRALQLQPNYAPAHKNLGHVLFDQGHVREAIRCYHRVLELSPGWAEVANHLAWILATHPDPDIRNGPEAVALARRACQATDYQPAEYLGTLAAAYAETGQFEQAIAIARRAFSRAEAQNKPALADSIRQELAQYEAHCPYHQQ